MSIISIVTIIIAIYGAILSTYSLYLNRKDKIATIRIKVADNFISVKKTNGPYFIQLKALNYGLLDITFNDVFITTKTKKFSFKPDNKHVNFPYELLKGKTVQVLIDPEEIALKLQQDNYSGKIKLIGIFVDALGNEYKSKPFKFDITRWLRNI